MENTNVLIHERDGSVFERAPIRVSADVPEIVLIEGDLRSGKTLYMVEAVYQLWDQRTPGVYANFTIHGIPNLQVLKSVTYNTLLGIPPMSIAAFSEIYHLFDKRTSMKKDQVRNTQALQQIGKCQYKLLVDCFEGNLLDFRFMEQVTDIIHSWGPIEQILEKGHYRNIPKDTLGQILQDTGLIHRNIDGAAVQEVLCDA